MQLLGYRLPDDHNLFLFGDVHTGSSLIHKEGWDKMIDMMHSEVDGVASNFGVDHGDIIEAIDLSDPRFDPYTNEGYILDQIKEAIRMRKPIAKKMLTILEGNHPLKKWRFGEITKQVCQELNVAYGTWTAKISIFAKRKNTYTLMYKHYCTHGRRQVSSSADDPQRRLVNMKIALKRQMKFKAGDCLLMSKGHTHKLLISKPVSELYLVDDGKMLHQRYTESPQTAEYIHPDHRWYFNTGSFMKLYGMGLSGYAEQAEYDPIE